MQGMGFSYREYTWLKTHATVNSNADTLIKAYWSSRGGRRTQDKSKPRKSDTKSKTSAVQKRKSITTIAEDSDEQPAPKKRGRPPKAPVSDDDEPVVKAKEAKKSTKSAGASASTSTKKTARHNDEEEDEEEETEAEAKYVSMKKKWRNAPSWDHLVDHIETVERTSDGTLNVFFALYVSLYLMLLLSLTRLSLCSKSQNGQQGELCREESAICKEKMPQMVRFVQVMVSARSNSCMH
jgi:hypothetical protein